MSRDAYNTDSLHWQARQTLRRFQEWLEYQFSQSDVDFPEFPNWTWSEDIAKAIFWILVAALTLWIVWLLYKALADPIRRWLDKDQKWVTLGRAEMPVKTYSTQHWLKQAQAQAQQGNYGEACKALYRATLQRLHDTQTLLHDPSRTDGEYLAGLAQPSEKLETTEEPVSPRPYQLLIGTHERLTFGRAIASAEMFKRCRRAYEEITKK